MKTVFKTKRSVHKCRTTHSLLCYGKKEKGLECGRGPQDSQHTDFCVIHINKQRAAQGSLLHTEFTEGTHFYLLHSTLK